MIPQDPADRFFSTMICLCALMCSVLGAAEYRKEIGTYVGARPVVLHRLVKGLPGCESGKWECLRTPGGTIVMRHPEK
jgi:hypothetical protein